jgi:hypothetical protein
MVMKHSSGTKKLLFLIFLLFLTVVLPFGCMPYQLKAILDGPQGKGLSISPSVTVLGTSSTFAFTASGGVGPYAYALVSGGGSVDLVTGVYTAPVTAGSAVIQVTDKTGRSVEAAVTILTAILAITPSAAAVSVNGSLTFVATGGTPPYAFSITTNNSGSPGIVTTGNVGSYVAGSTPLGDVVQVKDSALPTAHIAMANVNVVPLISPDYAVSFDPNIPWSGIAGNVMSNTGTTQIKIQNVTANPGHANIQWSVYLSANNVLDAGATLVQQGTIGPLAGSGSALVTFAGNWPAVSGVYYLIAAVQSSDDSNVTNNVVVGHVTAVGEYRYQEGPEVNDGVGPANLGGLTTSTTSDTGLNGPVSYLGANQTLVVEGVMKAFSQYSTFRLTLSAGLSKMNVQSFWATGFDDINTTVWDSTILQYGSSTTGINMEPAPLGTFNIPIAGPGVWYVGEDFYLANNTSLSTGKKYVILITGLP